MSTTSDTFDKAKNRAAELAGDVKDYAAASVNEQAESARDQAVDGMENAANAADSASDAFDPNSLQAAALDQLGAQINSVAARLRDKPLDEMTDDVAVFARNNPLLFLGGAALVGFAAARFLKAGNGTHTSDSMTDDPWSGHLNSPEA